MTASVPVTGVEELAKTIWLAGFVRAFGRQPTDPWENQSEKTKSSFLDDAQKIIEAGWSRAAQGPDHTALLQEILKIAESGEIPDRHDRWHSACDTTCINEIATIARAALGTAGAVEACPNCHQPLGNNHALWCPAAPTAPSAALDPATVEALVKRIELARSFIAAEYADPAQEVKGDWISPNARPAHDALCLCLKDLESPVTSTPSTSGDGQ